MDIIRAWKDEGYRNSLSEAERAALPENPAGLIALTDEDLGAVAGGLKETIPFVMCNATNLPRLCGASFDCPPPCD
jgi:mersacidin/lichenicidin family type 2 lantibiotic